VLIDRPEEQTVILPPVSFQDQDLAEAIAASRSLALGRPQEVTFRDRVWVVDLAPREG
jgi:hypothetical protein